MDTSTNVLTGGSGNDTLTITSSGVDDTIVVTSITAFETIALVDDGDATADTFTITTADANIADGASMTIDGSALSTDDLTASAAAESNGAITIKGGGGDDAITASVSDMGDTLEGGAGDVFHYYHCWFYFC